MKPQKPQPSKQGYNWMIWVAAAIGCFLAATMPSETARDPVEDRAKEIEIERAARKLVDDRETEREIEQHHQDVTDQLVRSGWKRRVLPDGTVRLEGPWILPSGMRLNLHSKPIKRPGKDYGANLDSAGFQIPTAKQEEDLQKTLDRFKEGQKRWRPK